MVSGKGPRKATFQSRSWWSINFVTLQPACNRSPAGLRALHAAG
jgi:hypothetical protein